MEGAQALLAEKQSLQQFIIAASRSQLRPSVFLDLRTLVPHLRLNGIVPVERVELRDLIEQLQNVNDAHRKAVVGERGTFHVLFVQLVLRNQNILDVVDGQSWVLRETLS